MNCLVNIGIIRFNEKKAEIKSHQTYWMVVSFSLLYNKSIVSLEPTGILRAHIIFFRVFRDLDSRLKTQRKISGKIGTSDTSSGVYNDRWR